MKRNTQHNIAKTRQWFLLNSFYLLPLCVAMISCKKESPLTPSEATELRVGYSLPQGSNAFDQTLQQWYSEYQTYFLYKFDSLDFGYEQTRPQSTANLIGVRFTTEAAQDQNMANGLDFIQKNWLSFYPQAFLRNTLPFKVLLAGNILQRSNSKKFSAVTGFDHLTIGYFSEELPTFTNARKKAHKDSIQREFASYLINRSRLSLPSAFFTVSNYTQTGINTTNMFQFGFIGITATVGDNRQNTDFLLFLQAVLTTPKADLDQTIMLPSRDTQGLVRRKYDILVNYFRDVHGFDIQQIGNTAFVP